MFAQNTALKHMTLNGKTQSFYFILQHHDCLQDSNFDMIETAARIKKIKLLKKIRKISVERGRNGQFLQAHSCEMTKI